MTNEARPVASRSPAAARSRQPLRWLAIAAAVALAGCAGRGGPESGGHMKDDLTCHSAQQCRVQVSVSCTGSTCKLAVQYPVVGANGFDVVWEIVNQPGQSYTFTDDSGIAFKTDAGRNAFRCHREANGSRIACMNRGTRGEFEYAVRVGGAPSVPPLDPWVVNHAFN